MTEFSIAHGNGEQESRIMAAESILYDWACGNFTTAQAKDMLSDLLFEVDFRQSDRGNTIKAYDWLREEHVELEC